MPWVLLGALMAGAGILRAIGLDGGLWWDEMRTLVDSVRQPLARIVTVFPGNNQHTLYSVLAHLSIGAFGEAPWSLRLPAFVSGVLSIPALYFFAREFAGRTEALLGALLLAVGYHPVWFAQNARGYTLLALLTLASSTFLLRTLRRGRTSDAVWYGVAAALGAYTHLTMLFVVAAHALACVVLLGVPGSRVESSPSWRRLAVAFGLAAALALLLYAPLLADVRQFFRKAPNPAEVATPAWAAVEMLRGLRIASGTAAGALFAFVLMVCGLASYFRQSRFLAALFVFPGLLTVVATLLSGRPVFPRFLFFATGFAVLLIVRGALDVGRWLARRQARDAVPAPAMAAGIAIVGGLAALSAAALADNYRYPKQDFGGAIEFVRAHRVEGEPVITAGGAMYPYREYYRLPWQGVTSPDEVRVLRSAGRRVWMLYTLPEYVAMRSPPLMTLIESECSTEAILRGTVTSGDLVVCAFPARAADDASPAPVR